jgi:hypothetical protein
MSVLLALPGFELALAFHFLGKFTKKRLRNLFIIFGPMLKLETIG